MRRALYILPVVVFATGFGIGALLIDRQHTTDLSSSDGSDKNAPDAASTANGPTFSSGEEMLKAATAAMADGAPFQKSHRLHELLAGLDSQEMHTLFNQALKMDMRAGRNTLLKALLARWAEIDPAAAAAAVKPFSDRIKTTIRFDWRSVEASVCQAWAQAVPETALAEALATPKSAWARSFGYSALSTLADGDAAAQLEFLARMPASSLRAELCTGAINRFADLDPAAAEGMLELLPADKRPAALSQILAKLAAQNPAAALERIEALAGKLAPGLSTSRMISEVLRAAGAKDAASALAAAKKLPESLRDQAMGAALVGWAGENPTAALEWAMANGLNVSEIRATMYYGENYGGSNSLISKAMEKDYPAALSWLRSQPPSRQRDQMMREGLWNASAERKFELYAEFTAQGQASAAGEMASSLARNDMKRAEEWVANLPAGKARTEAIENLAAAKAENDPKIVEAVVASWPPGPERDAALSGIASSLADNHPDRSMETAKRIANPETRQETFENIARNWMWRDEAAARKWLTDTPEISAETKRVILRQHEDYRQ